MKHSTVHYQNLGKNPNKIIDLISKLPFILVIIHLICFILTYLNFYNDLYNILVELIDTSLLYCFVFIGLSKVFIWNNFINKNINLLLSFNIVNLFIDSETNKYYHNIFQWLLMMYFIYMILYTKYNNGRKVENN